MVRGRRWKTIVPNFVLGCVALALLVAAPAQAAFKEDWRLDFSFTGSGSTAGPFSISHRIAVDQSTGHVYVLDVASDAVSKFDADGNPVNFSSTGTSSLTGASTPDGSFGLNFESSVTVDNSTGPNQGRIYINTGGGPVNAFDATGAFLWQIPTATFLHADGTATDKAGFLWVADFFKDSALKFDKSGSPPALLDQVPLDDMGPRYIDLDAGGNLYVSNGSRVDKFVNGEFASTLDQTANGAIAIDQSSSAGRIYTLHTESFTEFAASGTEIGTYGGMNGGVDIAYYKALDRVYVAEWGQVKVFEHVVGTVPDASVGPVSNITGTTAMLSGTVNPQGVNNDYRFEWKKRSQAWGEGGTSPAQTLPADSSDHAVSYEATGLEADTAYEFRIVARNTDIDLSATSGVGSFGNIPVEAVVRGAAPRTDTSARLNGFVDPGGNPAQFHFEYSLDGVGWTPLPEDEIAASAEPVAVSAELSGLQPDTPYSYRLVSETLIGSDQSDVATFRTRSSAELVMPQRGFEMVSNPDKGTQNALAFGPFDGTSPLSTDGNRVLWTVLAGAPGANSGSQAAFLAQRTSNGWQSKSLVPPAAQQAGGGRFLYRVESAKPDFSKFIFLAAPSNFFLSPPESVLRLDPGGTQDLLATYQIPVNESVGVGAEMTDDGTHVIAVNPDTNQLEELGSGEPEVVGLLPDGSQWSCEFGGETGNAFKGPGNRAAGIAWRPGYRRIEVTNASRIYFQALAADECEEGKWGLYVRNRESGETKLIDPGTPADLFTGDSHLIRATPDGRHAFFATFSKLDPDDENEHGDLYRWDEGSGSSTCLTCAAHPDVEMLTNNASIAAPLVSDDFSHFYFTSQKALAPGASELASDANIYALKGDEINFVARVSTRPLGNERSSLLSADGNTLTFIDRAGITTDAVAQTCRDPALGELEPCVQLYRYDDRDESLECLSCAHGTTTTHSVGSAYVLPQPSDFKMSADGSTVAFATAEKLLPLDVNNDIDIYEWRNGALRLITDGVTAYKKGVSALQVRALDHDGSNLLFAAVAPGLTGFERDGLAAIYDARIGGGFEPAAPRVPCVEEACQGPLEPEPSLPPASSAGFSGGGNLAGKPRARRCPKGKMRVRGKARRRARCVSRRQGKKRAPRRARTDRQPRRAK
jgi:hypothetical protein